MSGAHSSNDINVPLKKYVDLQVRALGKLFKVQIRSLKALVKAARAEVPIALASLKDRLEGMNEFRRSMDDMGKQFQAALASLSDKFATKASHDEVDRRVRNLETTAVSPATVKGLDDALQKLERTSASGDTVGAIDRRLQTMEKNYEGNTSRIQAIAALEANVANLEKTYVTSGDLGQVDKRVKDLETELAKVRAGAVGTKEGGAELRQMKMMFVGAVITTVVGLLIVAAWVALKATPH